MTEEVWNPWHGCKKYSDGCQNCYVYRRDGLVGLDASEVKKNLSFDYPLKKGRDGAYKIPPGSTVFCCMTSDFFLEEADDWRPDIWKIIKTRSDVNFIIITKRIVRFYDCIPNDWGEGYKNVVFGCTVENQKWCDIRLPVFNDIPAAGKIIICEPLLGPIDMRRYLNGNIKQVIAGGESGNEARVCDYDWVLNLREQCKEAGVSFRFKQTGARLKKDGKIYRILRRYQHLQARKAGIDI